MVLPQNVARDRVIEIMKARGIQTSLHYPPIHQFQFYRENLSAPDDLKVTEELGRRLLTLPLYPGLSHEQVGYVCESFRAAVDLAGADAA